MDSQYETDSEAEYEAVPDENVASGPGAMLREARMAKGLETGQVAAETRIPLRHLEAIEDERFEDLPSRTYAIGFSRQYARIVGLDEEHILDLVRAEMADADSHRTMVGGGMEPGDPAKLPSSGLAWFGGIAAVILAIGAIAFFSTYYGSGAQLPSLLAGPEEEEAAPTEEQAAPAQAAAAGPSEDGQVVFTALADDIWVRFYEEDGERLFEKIMQEGETFELPKTASEPRINTARPDLFAITIDGQEVPKLSEEAQVVGAEPVSAAALLARADTAETEETADN